MLIPYNLVHDALLELYHCLPFVPCKQLCSSLYLAGRNTRYLRCIFRGEPLVQHGFFKGIKAGCVLCDKVFIIHIVFNKYVHQ